MVVWWVLLVGDDDAHAVLVDVHVFHVVSMLLWYMWYYVEFVYQTLYSVEVWEYGSMLVW